MSKAEIILYGVSFTAALIFGAFMMMFAIA